MRKIALIAVLLIVGGWMPCQAQSSSTSGSITASGTTCATAGACVTLNLPQTTAVIGISISGTYSGTQNFEVTALGGAPSAVTCFPPNSTTGVTSTTGIGSWICSGAAMQSVDVRCSSYSSGTAVVNIVATNAVSAGLLTPWQKSLLSFIPGTGGGSPPPIMITDNFTRANADPLSNTASSVWNTDAILCNLKIASNLAIISTTGMVCSESNTGAVFPANQKAASTINTLDPSQANYVGVGVRLDGTGDGYLAFAGSTTDPTIYVQKSTAGVRATMGATFPYTFAMGDKIELDASGSSTVTLTLLINGVSQGTRTDSSSPFATGNPGIVMFGAGPSSLSASSTLFCAGALAASC